MKTKYIILFIMIGMLGFAKEGYVNARICPVQSSNEASSAKVGILKQGQKVSILETKGEWLQIKSDTIQGFVKTRFISNEPVVVIATVADSMKDLSNIEVRKRASTYTSSARQSEGFLQNLFVTVRMFLLTIMILNQSSGLKIIFPLPLKPLKNFLFKNLINKNSHRSCLKAFM